MFMCSVRVSSLLWLTRPCLVLCLAALQASFCHLCDWGPTFPFLQHTDALLVGLWSCWSLTWNPLPLVSFCNSVSTFQISVQFHIFRETFGSHSAPKQQTLMPCHTAFLPFCSLYPLSLRTCFTCLLLFIFPH